MYHSIQSILNKEHVSTKPSLDPIHLSYKGIDFHIYGLLHGLSGGTNQEYVKLINDSIHTAPGLKLSEKSMKQMYKGIDYELEDWIQIPFSHIILLTFQLFKTPWHLFKVFKTFIKEKMTKKDRFTSFTNRRIQDIGGSPYFHHLSPSERRLICGFPSPQDYFKINSDRRNHDYSYPSPVFPDLDWFWLTSIEKFANIPFRSIHMIEYAVLLANKHGYKECSLFVGEIHNSDIEWYIKQEHTQEEISQFQLIQERAKNYFTQSSCQQLLSKISYLFGSAIGFILSISLWLLIFTLLKYYFIK